MIIAILLILLILWFLGYTPLISLNVPLFRFVGRSIDLWDIFIFLVIIWLIGILPSPFRQIAGVAFLLWILSTLGIIAIAGLSNILVIAFIVGLIIYILR